MDTLIGIIYLSTAKIEFDESSLLNLAKEAANKNNLLGVTGYLYFIKGKFLQYLEGEAEAVQSVYDRIKHDHRHEVINVIQKLNIDDRKFPSWNMKYITKEMLTEINIENLVIEGMEHIKKVKQITSNQLTLLEKEKPIWRMVDTIARLSN